MSLIFRIPSFALGMNGIQPVLPGQYKLDYIEVEGNVLRKVYYNGSNMKTYEELTEEDKKNLLDIEINLNN